MDPTTGGVPQGKLRLLKSRLKRKDSGRSKAQRPSPTNKQRTAASGARAIRQPGPDFHARRAANSAAGAAAGAGSGAGMGGVGAAGGSGRGAELARAVPHSERPVRGARAAVPAGQASGQPPVNIKQVTKPVVEWGCTVCKRECIPVREESRCMCGHRLKHHKANLANKKKHFACGEPRCNCRRFFYVVAEGAWILRCRCKHKHIEHDATKAAHPCKRERCQCDHFDSPWVCNCDHAWGQHKQVFKNRTVFLMNGMPVPSNIAAEMNLVARGGLAPGGAAAASGAGGAGAGAADSGYSVTEIS